MSDTARVFVTLTSGRIASLVTRAKVNAAIAAPGLTCEVAEALVTAHQLGARVTAVVDCNDEVCRLGYGEVTAVRHLVNAGIRVGQCPGLRAGLLVVDDEAWAFTPTPLSVERERQSDETPNAVRLNASQARELLVALAPQVAADQRELFGAPKAEIGSSPLRPAELLKVEKSLREVPPLNFDLQRQVRVFQPYIQYVELSLIGCSVSKHTVTLPPSLAPLAKRQAVQARLRTTFSLLSEGSKLSDKHLQDELNEIRKAFTCPIKALGGSVMIRGKQPQLETRLGELEKKIGKYKEQLAKGLQRELDTSRAQLKRELLPLVQRNPPDQLLNRCMSEKPSRDETERWLDYELATVFPTPDAVTREIQLKKVFKAVTYESLNNPELQSELKKAFPAVAWEKPFAEFDAAQADPQRPSARSPQAALGFD